MKIPVLTNGYPRWSQNLFVQCIGQLYAALNAILDHLPDHVLSGVDITDNGDGTYNVSEGIVYVDGALRTFIHTPAYSGSLPIRIIAIPDQNDDYRPLFSGGTASTSLNKRAGIDLTYTPDID